MASLSVRLAVQSDLPDLSRFLGKEIKTLLGESLIALNSEGLIVGVLSYSRVFSTWEGRAMSINSIQVADDSIGKRLVIALAKLAQSEECKRIDVYTADGVLAKTLTDLGASDLTAIEAWNAFELTSLAKKRKATASSRK